MTNPDLLIKRALAAVIDDIIKFLLCIGTGGILWLGSYMISLLPSSPIRGIIAILWLLLMLLLILLIPFLYHILLESHLGKGQTLGKRILKIKVTTLDGKVPSYSQATIRTILRLVDNCFFYLVGLAVILLSEKDQRIGDILANTIVVEEK